MFLGSLITNPSSDFQNSKWRIQNGGWQKLKYKLTGIILITRGIMKVTEYKFGTRFPKSKMADSKWQTKIRKLEFIYQFSFVTMFKMALNMNPFSNFLNLKRWMKHTHTRVCIGMFERTLMFLSPHYLLHEHKLLIYVMFTTFSLPQDHGEDVVVNGPILFCFFFIYLFFFCNFCDFYYFF